MIHEMLLVEKYRPLTLSQVIGGDELKGLYDGISNDPWSLPNILLVTRSAGTGKTSIARAIIADIGADSLFLNASDDRGINTIRDKVKEFAMTQGFNRNAPKVVHLDEADGLTKEAQDSLRGIMEQYHSNCRFIFTCNNESKIIEPIKSRCISFNLNNPPKEKIHQRIVEIATSEGLNLKSDTIDSIIDMFYPDIRSMINAIDSIKYFGKYEGNPKAAYKEVYELLKKSHVTSARKLWISGQLNPRLLIKEIYWSVIGDETLDKSQITKAVEEIAEADFRIAMGSDAEITLANLAIRLASSAFK